MDVLAHQRISKDNHAPEILLAQARLLFNAVGVIIQVAVIIILALIQRDSTPLQSSLPLILTISAICFYRFWLSRRYRDLAETPENVKYCLDRHTAALALSGLVFGAAAIFYIPGASPELQIFSALVLGGLASGAMASLLPSIRTYVSLFCRQSFPRSYFSSCREPNLDIPPALWRPC
jgi:purine-cytosine permease-like protein